MHLTNDYWLHINICGFQLKKQKLSTIKRTVEIALTIAHRACEKSDIASYILFGNFQ